MRVLRYQARLKGGVTVFILFRLILGHIEKNYCFPPPRASLLNNNKTTTKYYYHFVEFNVFDTLNSHFYVRVDSFGLLLR